MLCQRGLSPPHCLSKVKTLNPREFCWHSPPPRRSLLSGISSCATLSFAPWTWKPLGAWSRFSSISFCGALRFAPWALTRVWASSRFSGISSCGGLAWPCGPSFPCILLLWGSASGAPPQGAKNGPFAQRPYNGFISAVTGSILQFLAFWAFISLHFGRAGLHFLSFPVKPLPSANGPYLKWDFLLAPLAGMGVFPVKPLPPANVPCLKWDFLLVPLPGMDLLPVKPLPSADDPCLK